MTSSFRELLWIYLWSFSASVRVPNHMHRYFRVGLFSRTLDGLKSLHRVVSIIVMNLRSYLTLQVFIISLKLSTCPILCTEMCWLTLFLSPVYKETSSRSILSHWFKFLQIVLYPVDVELTPDISMFWVESTLIVQSWGIGTCWASNGECCCVKFQLFHSELIYSLLSRVTTAT